MCNLILYLSVIGPFKKMKEASAQQGDLEGPKLYKNRNLATNQKSLRPLKLFFSILKVLSLWGQSGLKSSKKVQFREITRFYQRQKSTILDHTIFFILTLLWLPTTTSTSCFKLSDWSMKNQKSQLFVNITTIQWKNLISMKISNTVSYTHLTLPTILLV